MDKLMEKVSEAVDAEDFYSEYFEGKLDEKRNYPCPFPDLHKKGEDKLPSFRIFLRNGGTFCHGCGFKSSSPIGFLAKVKGIPMNKATRILYRKYVEKTVLPDVYKSPAEKLLANKFILSQVMDKRGLTKETIQKFQLGYDGRRLTIPIFNEDGFCVNLRRYDLFKDSGPKVVSLAEGTGKARLFPIESLQSKTVFVLEGELDAITACQLGVAGITPSGGAKAWDDKWGRLFKDKHVVILPDNDKPGMDGAKTRKASIEKHAKSCRIVKLPVKKEGEDITDWVVSYDGTIKKLMALTETEEDNKKEELEDRRAFARRPDIFDGMDDHKRSKAEEQMLMRADMIWDELINNGAFFKNSNGNLFYAGEGIEAMLVSATVGPFMSHLFGMTPLVNQATACGRFILNHVIARAFTESEFSKTGVWTMCDGGRIFIHAGSDKILRLGQGKPEHIKNAVNEYHILLDLPVHSMAIKALPTSKPAEGLNLLKTLFMDNLAMCDEDKYLLVSWMLSIFFRDYVRPKPIVRFLAKTASGKSTSSKLVSLLLYGEELLSHAASTMASTYEMSNRYPLLILDNIETRNMTEPLNDFLLMAATGGMRTKRVMGADSGMILQHVNSLVLTNGIEPFTKHELIDRTLEINLDLEKYANPRYQETRVFAGIRENREKIMSSVLYLLSQYVLPRVSRGEIARIMKEFGSHGKERFNEYLAVMCIVLDAIWGFMPLDAYKRPHDLVNYWLDNQTQAEHVQDEGTNEVLYFLSTFVDRADQLLGSNIKVQRDGGEDQIILKCTTRELLSDFRVLSKHLGIRCPWQSERQLGTRIVDSMQILNRAGWHRRTYESSGKRRYEYKYRGKLVKRERSE